MTLAPAACHVLALEIGTWSSGATRRRCCWPVRGMGAFMGSLIVAEIGGWLVLIAGFLDGQVL
jgi:hypothetical protein